MQPTFCIDWEACGIWQKIGFLCGQSIKEFKKKPLLNEPRILMVTVDSTHSIHIIVCTWTSITETKGTNCKYFIVEHIVTCIKPKYPLYIINSREALLISFCLYAYHYRIHYTLTHIIKVKVEKRHVCFFSFMQKLLSRLRWNLEKKYNNNKLY